MTSLSDSRQNVHTQYTVLLQWHYLTASLEEVHHLQDEYMTKVFFALSQKLSEMQQDLEEIKLITAIQTQLAHIFESVTAQAEALFLDIPTSGTESDSAAQHASLSTFQLSATIKSSLKTFETLTQSLLKLRQALSVNINKIPCKDITLDSSEVLQSLIDLNNSLSQLMPETAGTEESSLSTVLQGSMDFDVLLQSVNSLCGTVKTEASTLKSTEGQILDASDTALNLVSHLSEQLHEDP